MTILFDFDGTIADSLTSSVMIFNQVAHQYMLPQIKPDEIDQFRSVSLKELVKKYQISPTTLARLVVYIQKEQKKNIEAIEPIDGMPHLLESIIKAGHTVGIVTSNTKPAVKQFLQNNHIGNISFIHAEKNIFGKARVLKKIINQHHLTPEEVIYVGDEVRDIEAAQKAGIAAIAVVWGFNSSERLKAAEPNHISNTVVDLEQQLLNFSPTQN